MQAIRRKEEAEIVDYYLAYNSSEGEVLSSVISVGLLRSNQSSIFRLSANNWRTLENAFGSISRVAERETRF